VHRHIRFHAASHELELSHFMAYTFSDVAKVNSVAAKLHKVADESDSNALEGKFATVLLGIVALFKADRSSVHESVTHFDRINFELTSKFLLYEVTDTEVVQSTLLEKIFGVLGLYHRAVALEFLGRKDDAWEQYRIVAEFLFRFRQASFTQATSVFDFISASLYRAAMVLLDLGEARDAAASLRGFLVFYQVSPGALVAQPPNVSIRLIKSISLYMDLLDQHFRRLSFKSLCDDGQYQVLTGRDIGQTWLPESVREELILCSLLLQSIDSSSPEIQTALSLSNDLRQLSATAVRRFARIGYLDGIVKIQKTRFQTTVVDHSIYAHLFHSLYTATKYEEAYLAANMYLQSNGKKDMVTLLMISRFLLALPSKIDMAMNILDKQVNCTDLEAHLLVPYYLLKGQYWILRSRQETISMGPTYLARAKDVLRLLLKLDPKNAECIYFLALIESELRVDLDEAERLLKRSLSLNAGDSRAWSLFALIKSSRGDYEGALSICTSELANMVSKDFYLSLIRVSALTALNRSDEAIEVLKRIIAAHFKQSADLRMDGGTTVVSEGTFGPGSFLSKFLGDQGSMYEFEASMLNSEGKMTSFAEYSDAFPVSTADYVVSKANDGYAIPRHVLEARDLRELQLGRALRGLSQSSSLNLVASMLWLEVAHVYLHEGLVADAEAATLQSFRTNEVHAPNFAAFGLIEEARARPEEAEVFYRRGLTVDGDDFGCLIGLARVLLGKPSLSCAVFEAESYIRRLLQLDASIAEAWSLLGQACARTDRHAEAGSHLQRALIHDSATPLRSFRILPVTGME